MTDFEKFANRDRNISSMTLYRYGSALDAYINPSIIEERKLNIAAMDVFSRLMMDRIIFLGVGIDPDVANIVQAQLLYLASVDDKADISLYLNTPGGVVSAGLGIYDTMQLVKPDIATICTGMAASMGAVLLCAGAEGKRSCLPHSRVLIHQPLGGVQGQATDILIAAKEIEKTREELCSLIAEHTKQEHARVFSDMDRDYWMNAEEALQYGMVDQILKKIEKLCKNSARAPLGEVETQKITTMKNEMRKQLVERIYKENENRTDKGLDEMVITEALAAATDACDNQDDYFRALSALNLLNSAIKDKRWKRQLSYGFIKGQASSLFEQWIEEPVKGVKAYYDGKERAVFFDLAGVVFSYHNIRLSDSIRSFVKSAANKPIAWPGIRLQRIPVELFDLALAS